MNKISLGQLKANGSKLPPMHREIQLTADGSHTIAIPEMNTSYHSYHGAIAESRHVFIEAGLLPLIKQSTDQHIHILEIGFGTGLNALLSIKEATKHQFFVHYTAIEPFPLSREETEQINHGRLLFMEEEGMQLHACAWEQDIHFNEYFTLKKLNRPLLELNLLSPVNCIYFDAFAPVVQPEIWTQPVFERLYSFLTHGGLLVTYCSKSEVRRAMTAAGFTVTKMPGPYGKREMVRATKD
jgi:tRNA U34 5-methylaminomethyl-2-thiouridine-forming methyltransferase MnmC